MCVLILGNVVLLDLGLHEEGTMFVKGPPHLLLRRGLLRKRVVFLAVYVKNIVLFVPHEQLGLVIGGVALEGRLAPPLRQSWRLKSPLLSV